MQHRFSRSLSASKALILLAAMLALPVLPASPARAAEPAARYAADQVDRYVTHYELITLDPVEMGRKAEGAGRLAFTAGLEEFDVVLEPKDLRAPGYRAQVTHQDGSVELLPDAPVTTYAGHVTNREQSTARFTIDERGVSGLIIEPDEKFFLEPLSNYSLAGGPTDYVFYRASDVRPDAYPGTCGATAAEKLDVFVEELEPEAAEALAAATWVAQIATDADNEYVSALGSAAAANSEILSIVNQVDGVYQAEIGLQLQVTLQNSYGGQDPYTASTNSSTVLNEFRSYWNANMGGVPRDLAHLFTGKDMDGSTIGIAWVGVVCRSPTYAYGVSQRWTGSPQKYVLTAHEIGHNFNGCHSDTSCNPSTSSCSNTIMQSFVGTGFTFCGFSREQIGAFITTYSSCLGTGTAPPPPAPPAAPSGLSATAASAVQINLSWSDNSSDETGFKIERSVGGTSAWLQVATVGAGVRSYSDLGLAASTLHYYRVRATNSAGDSAYSNTASATTQAAGSVPAAPSNLSASPAASNRVNLSWSDNSSNETGFKIERSDNGGSFVQVATVGANATTYSNAGLKKKRTYTYRVRAYNASGNSGYSNTASATTPLR